MWTCEKCGRTFGKRRAHVCEEAMTVAQYFRDKPQLLPIYEAVAKHVKKLKGAHTEAVNVGILFKRERTFAELRPRRVGFALSLVMRRPLRSERITRSIAMSGEQLCNVVLLTQPKDVDQEVLNWLTEAFAS